MANPNERVPMDFSDTVALILLIIVTLAFVAYSADFFIGFMQMH
jgi:hypothetical protein